MARRDSRADQNLAYSIFIVDPEKHGDILASRLTQRLEELRTNPGNRLYTSEDHFAKRNPEAFRIAKEKSDLENTISSKDARIEELEKKLGFTKKA
jgi:hypothetical protein